MSAAEMSRSAKALGRAAHEIRDDATIATRSVRPFLIAVADFLDASALDAKGTTSFNQCDEPGAVQKALTIARAYLEGGAR